MKRVLVLLLVSFTMLAQAQKGKVIAAATALSENQLKEAKTLIIEALKNEEVQKMPKAWVTKGNVFMEIYVLQMEGLLSTPNSLEVADEAFKKAYELDLVDPKKPGKYKSDIAKGLFTVARGHFEKAVGKFNAGEYESGVTGFKNSAGLIQFLEDNSMVNSSDKEDATVIKKDAFQNGALCALNAKDYDGAAEIYESMIKMDIADEKVYANLSSIYISKSMYEEVKPILDKGLAKFPDNESLKESILNYYIGTDQADNAIDKLLIASEEKPDDADIKFNLALAYDKLGNKEKMVETYEKIIAVDPTYQAAYLNLGAYYNEQANDVIKTMNDMTDWKAAVKLEPQRDEWYNKALPNLEKAYSLDKSNPDVKRALERIYANMNMLDKVKELKGE